MPQTDIAATKAGQRVTLIGALANVLLIFCKFLAGIFGHSQALIADAFHSVSDFLTDAVVLVGLRMGRKAPDADHHFGHARIETMASGAVGISLVIVAILLGYDAARDIYLHTESEPTWVALAGACLSIIVKEMLYRYTARVGRRIKSPAVAANAWHHRSDALSSVAVLVGVTCAQINPDWHILDAYAALLVSLLIMKVGIEILWAALQEMADTAPPPDVLNTIIACIRGVPDVLEVHDLKVRSIGGFYSMSVRITVDGKLTVEQGHRVAEEVELCLTSKVENVGEVVVHVDPAEPAKASGPTTRQQ